MTRSALLTIGIKLSGTLADFDYPRRRKPHDRKETAERNSTPHPRFAARYGSGTVPDSAGTRPAGRPPAERSRPNTQIECWSNPPVHREHPHQIPQGQSERENTENRAPDDAFTADAIPDGPAGNRSERNCAEEYEQVELCTAHGDVKFADQIKRVITRDARKIEKF